MNEGYFSNKTKKDIYLLKLLFNIFIRFKNILLIINFFNKIYWKDFCKYHPKLEKQTISLLSDLHTEKEYIKLFHEMNICIFNH